jgi:hypothetical protein
MAEEIVGGLKGIKTELRGIEDQLSGLDRGSQEFIKLSQRAGELRDKMKEVKEAVGANAGPAIESLGNNARIAGEQLLSLDFEGFGQSLKSVAGNIRGVDFKSVKDGIGSMASGFATLGKALLTNPFFLIAGAVALIAMNFKSLISLFPGVEKGLTGINDLERKAAENAQKRADASSKAYESIDKQSNILKLQGKSERDILEMKIKQLGVAIQDRKAQLTIQQEQAKIQVETAKRNRAILDGMLHFITAPLEALVATVDLVGKAFGQDWNLRNKMMDAIGDLLIDPEEQEKQLNESIEKSKEALLAMENEYAGMKLEINAIDKKANDDRVKAQQDANDKLAKANADARAKELKATEEAEAAKKKAAEDAAAAALKANQDRIAAEDAQYMLQRELEEDAREKEIQDLIAQYDAKFMVANGNAQQEALLTQNLRAGIAEIVKKYADVETQAVKDAEAKKLAAKFQAAQKGLEMAGQVVDILLSLNEATAKGDKASQKRAFDRNKKLQKAQAAINMAAGIVSAWSAPDNVTMAQKIAASAVIAASGAANIVKINKTKFEGGGDTGGGNDGTNTSVASSGVNTSLGGPGSASATAISPLNLGFLQGAGQQAQPIQTYVLAGNVASSLHARQQIENQARIDK